jgi:outer membrane protein assembly factor BamC
MRLTQWLVPAVAASVLCSCSSISDLNAIVGDVTGKNDYKSAAKQSLPPLEIPPNLTRPSGDDRFSLPAGAAGANTYSAFSATDKGPRAGSTDLLPTISKARVERSGSQRWLVVNETPEKIWPVVKEFWQESGFLINLEVPESGVMETDWAENRAKIPTDILRRTLGRIIDQVYSTGERDKFRTRLERGAEPNSTEIYVSHRGVAEVGSPTSGFVWQPRPADPDLEAEFLGKLMVRFGVEQSRARETIAAADKIDRAKLVKSADGSGQIELAEPFDRAWRRVGLALDRVGFTVEDRDRSKGYYFVRYVDPEKDAASGKKEPGIFDKLAFWRSSSAPVSTEQYRVLVKDGNESSQIQVLDKNGAAERSDTGRRILSLLHEQLK